MRLGIISDTHGMLRPEVFEVFAEVDHILHAGDIGELELLTELEALAPVTAVYGNTDGMDLRARLPRSPFTNLESLGVFSMLTLTPARLANRKRARAMEISEQGIRTLMIISG